MQERFTLMRERIGEIQEEELVREPYRDFFRKTGDFILEICRIYDRIREGWLEKASMGELEENNFLFCPQCDRSKPCWNHWIDSL